MKYYILKTTIALTDGKATAIETILTRPDLIKATNEALRRYDAIGIENVSVCKHNAKQYKARMAAQNKRRLAARKLTVAEVAEIIEEVEKLKA
jgi:hypothetical protein